MKYRKIYLPLRVLLLVCILIITLTVSKTSVTSQSLRIGIQAGHWQQVGRTGGVSPCDGTEERVINKQVADRVANVLIGRGFPQTIVLSAEGAIDNWTIDGYPNDYFDIFISLHLDNFIYCSSDPPLPSDPAGFKVAGPSNQLVDSLWSEYEASTDLPRDPGHITVDMTDYYAFNYLTSDTYMAIIEMGWLSNQFELSYITSANGQNRMAQGIANAIVNFLSDGDQYSSTATLMVVDVSGSMGDSWQGGIKIESAKSAANQIVNMLEQESDVSGGIVHRLGVATFTTDAALNMALSPDYDQARSIIASLVPLRNTNIGAGLIVANQSLTQAGSNEDKFIILLSDGKSNTGLSHDEIITGPVQEAANAGTCIYTIGFGDPGDLDEDLLRRIAIGSGCGEYYYATDVIELERIYIRIRHISIGTLLAEFNGDVAQDQTVQAGEFEVPVGQGELAISLHWPGSALDLMLKDPRGNLIDSAYSGANITAYPNLIYTLVEQPLSGVWQLGVHGKDVPQGTTNFNALVSSRVGTFVSPSINFGPGILVVLLVLVTGGISVFAIARRRQHAYRTPGHKHPQGIPSLFVISGPLTGTKVPIVGGGMSIGRSRTCDLSIPDLSVSRQHARIRYSQGYWYIQDLGSRSGISVNGKSVTAVSLNAGDHIRIGSSEFEFHVS